jgi:hypothetical protein
MTAKDPLHDEIQALTGRLVHARDSLEKGAVPDLAPLQPLAARLCQEIEARPAANAQELRASLLMVIDELDHLETALKSGLEEVKGKIGEATERRRAASAYARR